jgi:hypothetical protein
MDPTMSLDAPLVNEVDDMFIRDSKQSSDHHFFLVAIFDICGQKTCKNSLFNEVDPSISRDATSICSPNRSG